MVSPQLQTTSEHHERNKAQIINTIHVHICIILFAYSWEVQKYRISIVSTGKVYLVEMAETAETAVNSSIY